MININQNVRLQEHDKYHACIDCDTCRWMASITFICWDPGPWLVGMRSYLEAASQQRNKTRYIEPFPNIVTIGYHSLTGSCILDRQYNWIITDLLFALPVGRRLCTHRHKKDDEAAETSAVICADDLSLLSGRLVRHPLKIVNLYGGRLTAASSDVSGLPRASVGARITE
ncbi:hypothetical protein Syun_029290 [Stephania yunnanensis]|uniref:Uncharacterized protein n=1 Tax=Stephania yunnanensis TaxID=152371 RepID=A0AAP0HJP8_9MAGN